MTGCSDSSSTPGDDAAASGADDGGVSGSHAGVSGGPSTSNDGGDAGLSGSSTDGDRDRGGADSGTATDGGAGESSSATAGTLGGEGSGYGGERGGGTGASGGTGGTRNSGGSGNVGGSGGAITNGAFFEPGDETMLLTKVIGPGGGTLTGPEGSLIAGVSVTFPTGALPTDTEISLGFNDGTLRNLVGSSSGPVIALHSAGATIFAQPVAFEVPVVDDGSLVAPYYIDDDNQLQPIALADVDAAREVATFYTFHASNFAQTNLPSGTCDSLLTSAASTGFTPSKDGFSFGNTSDYLPPGSRGICRGMMAYASWWFATSHGAGLAPKTCDKACIECQKDFATKAHGRVSSLWDQVVDRVRQISKDDRDQFCGIAAALANSGKPVPLGLHGTGEDHAVLATGYELKSCGGGDVAIHVYNPNHAKKNDEVICYDSKKKSWESYEGRDRIWLASGGSLKEDFSDLTCGPGGAHGDPHVYTFDGLYYDFQRVGEFLLVRGDTGLNVQVRLGPYANSKRIATIVAVAAQVGSDRVEINALGESGAELWVNGSLSSPQTLPGGGAVSMSGFTWPDGTQLDVGNWGGRLDVALHGFAQPGLHGLLGNVNGEPEDEFELRDGTTLTRPLDDVAWASFTEDWRITNAESLFHYEAGQDTSTFTDLSFPEALASVAGLDPSVYSAARGICLAAGVPEDSAALLDACILDVGMTGDADFAASAAAVPTPISTEATVCPGAVVGAPVALTNGDFESPHLSGNSWQTLSTGSAALTGWSVSGQVDITYGGFWQNAQGTQSLDLNGEGAGSIAQSISTLPGQAYQVSFWMAGNSYCTPNLKVFEVEAAGQRTSFQFDAVGHSFTAMGWQQASFVFRARDTTTLLSFSSLIGGACGPALDDVQVAQLDCPAPP